MENNDKVTAIREALVKAVEEKKAAVFAFERAAEYFIKTKLEWMLREMDDAEGVKIVIGNCASFSLRIPGDSARPFYDIDLFYTRAYYGARRTLKMSHVNFGGFSPRDRNPIRLVVLAGRVAFELDVLEDRISEFDWDGMDKAVDELRAANRALAAFDEVVKEVA